MLWRLSVSHYKYYSRGGWEVEGTVSLQPLVWIDLFPLFFTFGALLSKNNALGVSYSINTIQGLS